MRKLVGKGLSGPKTLAQLLLGSAACLVATNAAAQQQGPQAQGAPLRMKTDYFGYAASISPRVSYTDNVNLGPKDNKDDELFLSSLFSGAAIYSSKRFTGIINGDVDVSYVKSNSDVVANQDVGAAGTLTVADNIFYVDIAGSSSRQLLGESARFSTNINAARGQRANVHSYTASPYFYHQFADQSTAQLRYRFSQVLIGDDNSNANPYSPYGANFLNDSLSHSVTAVYDSGKAFDRFHFTLTAYGDRTIEDGSVVFPRYKYRQGSLMGEAQLPLSTAFALSGAVGYDDINTEMTPALFNDATLSGVFWRAGFAAQPGRRTSLRVEYGERFGDNFIDASFAYRLTERITFTAGANQTFETRAQSISTQNIDQERSLLDFADKLRQGVAMSPQGVITTATRLTDRSLNSQVTGVGVTKVANAQILASYGRTELSAYALYQDTDYSYRRDKTSTVNLNVHRDVTRKIAAYANGFYRWSDTEIDQATCVATPYVFGFDVTTPGFDAVSACLAFANVNGKFNTVGGRVGVSYRLYKHISAFAEYGYTKRLADDPLLEYQENNAVAGVTLDF